MDLWCNKPRVHFTVAMTCNNPGITARALASIADVLGAMAQDRGGLRSGPALNQQWQPAFQHLQVRAALNQQCSQPSSTYKYVQLSTSSGSQPSSTYEYAQLLRHTVVFSRHTALTSYAHIILITNTYYLFSLSGWQDC